MYFYIFAYDSVHLFMWLSVSLSSGLEEGNSKTISLMKNDFASFLVLKLVYTFFAEFLYAGIKALQF